MSDPFIAEIRIFAGDFAPRGWAFCNGQLLPIAQNNALFSLIGPIYGGNGRTDFALPDLQGRAPMHPGQGPGLTDRRLGDRGGAEDVALTTAQMPTHVHALRANPGPASTTTADGNSALARSVGGFSYASEAVVTYYTQLGEESLGESGNPGDGLAHNNMQPYLTLNFIIALVGVYPSRN